jgi:hypothetical protein
MDQCSIRLPALNLVGICARRWEVRRHLPTREILFSGGSGFEAGVVEDDASKRTNRWLFRWPWGHSGSAFPPAGISPEADGRRLKEMDEWHFIADRKIQEAMQDGAFDRLDGAGEPLDLNENPFEDPAQRMAHRLLRNNGFAPAWIEEGREIDAEIRRLKNEFNRLDGAERARRVDLLNRRIAAYNLKTPVASAQKLPFQTY